jgi:LmbE family N-acetylglucosaminyl deacetylase
VTAPARALVVAAHPDDCEYGCGATVAKWAADGCEVHVAVLTDGTKGSHDPDLDAQELAATRRAEQLEGARRLGVASVRFLDQVDGESALSDALLETLVLLVRETRAEVVLGHDPWLRYELHPDHLVAGRAACDAFFRAREPRFYPERPPPTSPRLPRELWLFRPQEADHVEDVTATVDAKVEAILCHRSQLATSFGVAADAPDARALVQARIVATLDGSDGAYGERFHRIVPS